MEPLPNMNPLLHWGNWGTIRGFHFLDPLGGLGNTSTGHVNMFFGLGVFSKLRCWCSGIM